MAFDRPSPDRGPARRARLAAGLVAVVAMTCATTTAGVAAEDGGGGISWGHDIEAALGLAAETGRPVLVDFYADWCRPCHVMEQQTYRDPRVIAAMAGFIPLKVDSDENDPFSLRYRVQTLPTTLVIDEAGRAVTILPGVLGPDDLLAVMNAVLEGYGTYVDQIARPGDPVALEQAAAYLFGIGNAEAATRLLKTCLTVLRGTSAPPERTEPIELKLAQAQFASGEIRQAATALEQLSRSASDPQVRGWALAGMIEVDRRRGRTIDAERTLERLRKDYPEIARQLEPGDGGGEP